MKGTTPVNFGEKYNMKVKAPINWWEAYNMKGKKYVVKCITSEKKYYFLIFLLSDIILVLFLTIAWHCYIDFSLCTDVATHSHVNQFIPFDHLFVFLFSPFVYFVFVGFRVVFCVCFLYVNTVPTWWWDGKVVRKEVGA